MRISVCLALLLSITACSPEPLPDTGRANPPRRSSPPPIDPPVAEVVTGGDGFDRAVHLQVDGETRFRTRVAPKTFFVFRARAGYRILVEAKTTDVVWATIFDASREQVAYRAGATAATDWLPASGLPSYDHYLVLEDPARRSLLVDVVLRFEDATDAATGTDAPGSADGASELAAGTYAGSLASRSFAKRGNDHEDWYRVAVKAGVTLKVRLTPPRGAQLEVRLLDAARTPQASQTGTSGGDVSIEWTPAADGSAFIGLKHHHGDGGTYSLEISK